MPYRDMFNNDIYQNEFDETMTRKFPHSYKIIKTIYPDAYKLPEDEISTMSDILRNQGDTYDEAETLLRKHINQKQPQWNLDYLNAQKTKKKAINENLNKYQTKHINRNTLSKLTDGLLKLDGTDFKQIGGQSLMGLEHILNGISMGGYGDLNRFTGGNYQERKDALQEQADQAEIGNLNYLVTRGLEVGGSFLPVTKFIPKTRGYQLAKYSYDMWKNYLK